MNPFLKVWYLSNQLEDSEKVDLNSHEHFSGCFTFFDSVTNEDKPDRKLEVLQSVKYTLNWMWYLGAIAYTMIIIPLIFGILACFFSCIGASAVGDNIKELPEELKEALKTYKEFN